MDITGKVAHVGDIETYGTFQKRVLVVENEGNNGYKNTYGFQVTGDHVSKYDKLKIGDDVTVSVFDDSLAKIRFNSGKWWPDLPTCMKVHVNAQGETPASQPEADGFGDDEADSLPF